MSLQSMGMRQWMLVTASSLCDDSIHVHYSTSRVQVGPYYGPRSMAKPSMGRKPIPDFELSFILYTKTCGLFFCYGRENSKREGLGS